ncbi:MAG TPA: hypothetical protein VHM70_16410 [Polyangiaceae bacterium]|jgi:hypothetical protein|nr:hypothetical protein [Polyangiaceae bacterium]
MHEHHSNIVVLTILALVSSCGARLADEAGGETSFLGCSQDADCTQGQGKCERGTCSEVGASGHTLSPRAVTTPAAVPETSPVPSPVPETSPLPSRAADAAGYTLQLIDDMEVPLRGGGSGFTWRYLGNWFLTTGSTSMDAERVALNPPRGDSTQSYWIGGAEDLLDLWAQLSHPLGDRVDLKSYEGISFWATSSVADARLTVALDVGWNIEDGLRAETPQKVVPVSSVWQYYEIPFSDLQAATGASSVDFIVDARSGAFDVWIDDLALLCAGPCPDLLQ